MTTPTDDELREWLRENLDLDVRFCDRWEPNNDVYVGLRFKGEDAPFARARVSIPTPELPQ